MSTWPPLLTRQMSRYLHSPIFWRLPHQHCLVSISTSQYLHIRHYVNPFKPYLIPIFFPLFPCFPFSTRATTFASWRAQLTFPCILEIKKASFFLGATHPSQESKDPSQPSVNAKVLARALSTAWKSIER